eukprot:COSAG02_NODE_23748_length_709_cov_1.281967_1_plen_35_part_01
MLACRPTVGQGPDVGYAMDRLKNNVRAHVQRRMLQ